MGLVVRSKIVSAGCQADVQLWPMAATPTQKPASSQHGAAMGIVRDGQTPRIK